MSATAQQTSQRPVPKVLRIGIAQDGKIAQEKLMKVGETVTVGDNPRNSFVLQGTKLPPRFDLFIPKGDSYVLQVPEWVEGKISWKDGIRGLDELRSRGEAVKKGDFYLIQLNENVRGKVSIGTTTLLFQFVPAPPEPVRAVTAADFRPRWIDDEDPLFHGLLTVFSLIAAAFMTWVYTSPPVERVDLDAIADAVDLVVDKEPEQIVIPDEKPPEPGETEKPDTKKPEADAKAEERAAPRRPNESVTASVERRSLLIQTIGTAGDAGGDAVADLIGDAASLQGLDEAIQGVSGVEQASAGNMGARSGSAGGKGDATVGVGIAGSGTGKVNTGAAAVTVKPKVVTEKEDVDVQEGDGGGIVTVVRKSQGRITTCLEQALKVNPGTNGRVSVGWMIVKGRVTDARIVQNTTGNAELGNCVVNAVRKFRFDEGLTAEVAEFPWVVSGQ
jgi:hypothetical protein